MDKTTFTQEVLKKEQTLYRIAISYMNNDADAQDVVQDALLTAWEKRNSLRNVELFNTWLVRILINRCKQHLRNQRPQAPLDEQLPANLPDATDDLALRLALDSLQLMYRIPLLLFHLEGYSIAEISTILRLPQNTVKSRLARGRMKLKELYEEEEVRAHA